MLSGAIARLRGHDPGEKTNWVPYGNSGFFAPCRWILQGLELFDQFRASYGVRAESLWASDTRGSEGRLSVVAIIPARGGSKRVPRKNVLPVGGIPLVLHTVNHALSADSVDEVIVSTDDDEIASLAKKAGADIVMRPKHLAGDTATSESALIHALDARNGAGKTDPDLVVFLQGTSPIRKRDDIDRAVAKLRDSNADSLFSAGRNFTFIWSNADTEPEPINHDFRARMREQDFRQKEQYYENGSIYVFKPKILRENNNRLGGKKALFEMGYWSSFQVDGPEDARLCDWILRNFETLSRD